MKGKLQKKISEVSLSGLTSLKNRVEFLKSLLEVKGADGFFINNLLNVFYLTGFTGSSGYVLIRKDKNYFFTDFRYMLQSKKEVSDLFKIVIINKFEEIFDYLKGEKRVLCEKESLTLDLYEELKKKKLKIKPIRSPVLDLRVFKNEEEIEKIRKAQKFSEKVLKKALSLLKPDKTKEIELALEIEYEMRKNGFQVAFPTIVASGKHSALPHAKPRNVTIKNNSILLIDMGSVYKGYHSDMTRTFWVGNNPPDWFKEIYEITLNALFMVEQNIKTGMNVKDADNIARSYITERGYGEKFGHGLGHGVGIEIHEKPSLSPRGKEIIDKGMVFTIEPGIYLENKGGVRIEDLVFINKKGELEILTCFTKRLKKI